MGLIYHTVIGSQDNFCPTAGCLFLVNSLVRDNDYVMMILTHSFFQLELKPSTDHILLGGSGFFCPPHQGFHDFG